MLIAESTIYFFVLFHQGDLRMASSGVCGHLVWASITATSAIL
jgi:hypothetical protein